MEIAFWRFTITVVVLLFLSLNLPISQAQNGTALTLSIDCGAKAIYTDNVTGITWVPDDAYIKTGIILNNITTKLQGASPRHQSLRYFSENQSKFCYELNATNGTTYLVRTTFLYGDYDGGTITKPSFHLHIDTSTIGIIKPDNSSNWEVVIEVTMSAVASKIYVCLAPTTPGIDVPFINSIELRKLDPLTYPKARQGYMMITNYRYNFGGDRDVRHPDDPYDRVWLKYPSSNAPGSRNLTSIQNVNVSNAYSRDKAPVGVMNTALTWPKDNTGFTLPLNVSGGRNYVVLLWFAEIELKAQIQSRGFVVGIDGKWQNPIDILDVTKGIKYEAYEWGYGSIALSETSTIALKATNRSALGPILNAMEVYGVSDPVQPRTDMRDVAAIDAIKLYSWPKLETWTGDPCLKIPYDWTSCSMDTIPRITMLKLDGYNLTGSIPAARMLNLTELTILSLANNSLDGSIPDLSALQKLQQLHLQYNNFSGAVPAWVANLTALQELSLASNSLDGSIPDLSALQKLQKLDLQYNNLSGAIPAWVANLTALQELSLANNSLDGSIPDLSALQKLQQLHLQFNSLSGTFPAWVANLTALQELFVEGNNFTGYIPQSLFNKTGLNFNYTPTVGLCTGPSPTLCNVTLSPPVASESSSSNKLAIIVGFLTGGLGLVILVCVIICLWRCKPKLFHYSNSVSSRQLLKADPEAAFSSTTKSQPMAYSFKEVKEATNNFQDQISEGSFGPVYKGKLSDGREVAVKRCRPCNKQGVTDFFDEVELLARVHHRNLTGLVGFCQDAQEQILLYGYRSNSDLRTHLHGDGKHLPWSTRLTIAADAAQGIEYLHTSCIPSIIHCDVQLRNILLTRKMTAKVADFAFAKFTSSQDPTLQAYSADVKGTAGYLDPEYSVSRHLTDKSDVYSFGVVLLELISGQEPINKTVSDRNPLLIEWMRPLLAKEDIKAVVDPSLEEKYNEDCMWKVAELGMMCVEPRPFNRPTMTEVVQELRDAIAMEGIAHPPSTTPSLASPTSAPSSGPL